MCPSRECLIIILTVTVTLKMCWFDEHSLYIGPFDAALIHPWYKGLVSNVECKKTYVTIATDFTMSMSKYYFSLSEIVIKMTKCKITFVKC